VSRVGLLKRVFVLSICRLVSWFRWDNLTVSTSIHLQDHKEDSKRRVVPIQRWLMRVFWCRAFTDRPAAGGVSAGGGAESLPADGGRRPDPGPHRTGGRLHGGAASHGGQTAGTQIQPHTHSGVRSSICCLASHLMSVTVVLKGTCTCCLGTVTGW